MDDGRRYWAFLSYSHKDRREARWLHRALEDYAVPRRLVGRQTSQGPAPRRFRPIFRDREDLSADADLRQRVGEALAHSAYLIVICSPAAARSTWVEEEIVRFKALHGESRVLAVIVAGAPRASATPGREDEECFPPALRVHIGDGGTLTAERADPIAADLRPGQDGRRLVRLKLLARMLEVGLDELIRRDTQRRQRQLVALSAVSGGAALVMGGLALAALAARNEARDQRAQAEGLVEFMLGDLRKKLEPEGRLDVLSAVGDRALSYYSRQASHGMDADALGRRARVLHLLGEIDDTRGDLTSALKRFQEAEATTAELLAREPENPQRVFEHAQSVYYVGEIADRRGDEAAAQAQFEEYKRLADQLVAKDPRNDDWLSEVEYANSNLGTVFMRESKDGPAEAAFQRALSVCQALARRAPGERDPQFDLAQAYAWVADAELALGRLDEAMRKRLAERDIYQALLARNALDNKVAAGLAINGDKIAEILAIQGRRGAAGARLTEAIAVEDRLSASEPSNTTYRDQAIQIREDLAQLRLEQGDVSAAKPLVLGAVEGAEALVRKDPTVAHWNGILLGGARLLDIKLNEAVAADDEERRQALAPAVEEAGRLDRLTAAHPFPDVRLLRVDAEAHLLAGDYELKGGSPDQAGIHWLRARQALVQAGDDDPRRSGQSGRNALIATDTRLSSLHIRGSQNTLAVSSSYTLMIGA